MKKVLLVLGISLVVVVLIVLVSNFYTTHKTRYLNMGFYDIETQSIIDPAYIKIRGFNLKGYPNKSRFNDEQIIKRVLDYLNSVPLTVVYQEDAPTDTNRVSQTIWNFLKNTLFLFASAEDFPTNTDGKSGSITFYNKRGIEIGWLHFRGEEYVLSGIDLCTYKVRDEGTLIITGLEELELD